MRLLRAIWAAIARMHHRDVRASRRRARGLRVTNYQFAIRKWFAAKALDRRERQRKGTP